jgi:hypothetical protein
MIEINYNPNLGNFTDSKHFVATGLIIFTDVSLFIPNSRFIVNSTDSGLFEATNIDFVLGSAGDSLGEAVQVLARLTSAWVEEVFSRWGVQGLLDVMREDVLVDYLQEFHRIENASVRAKDVLFPAPRPLCQEQPSLECVAWVSGYAGREAESSLPVAS